MHGTPANNLAMTEQPGGLMVAQHGYAFLLAHPTLDADGTWRVDPDLTAGRSR